VLLADVPMADFPLNRSACRIGAIRLDCSHARVSPGPDLRGGTSGPRAAVLRIARRLGFVGRVEYRHVYSRSGGAQYGLASSQQQDLLVVYAEAFERDATPDDYSLEAIIAHECGHQLLARHPRVAPRVAGRISWVGEEVLASILGGLICAETRDRENLYAKAVAELLFRGEQPEVATRLVAQLWENLEAFL
jgi:hypothetical protein